MQSELGRNGQVFYARGQVGRRNHPYKTACALTLSAPPSHGNSTRNARRPVIMCSTVKFGLLA